MSGKLRITLVKSPIGYRKDQKRTVSALGLGNLCSVVEHEDHPTIRGMIRKISHLVKVEEVMEDEVA
jgi:large subunit ribosomal protein L30